MARDIEQITPFTALEDSVVRNAGVEALPNSPSSAGIRASELKRRFYQPLEEVRDDIDDRFTKINSNFEEIDEDLTTLEGLAFDKANVEQEVSTSTTKVPSSNLLKTQLDLKVSKAGAQDITGIKTYKTGAVPLIEDAPTSDTMAVNKAYADTKIPNTALQTSMSGTPLDTNVLSEKYIHETYATKSDIASVFEYKGTVADYTALSAITGQGVGDTYNMTASYLNTPAGTNWAWNGTTWDALGGDIIIETAQSTSAVKVPSSKLLKESSFARVYREKTDFTYDNETITFPGFVKLLTFNFTKVAIRLFLGDMPNVKPLSASSGTLFLTRVSQDAVFAKWVTSGRATTDLKIYDYETYIAINDEDNKWCGWKQLINAEDAQTISGVKTYTASPIVPTSPSGASAAVAKSYVDGQFPEGFIGNDNLGDVDKYFKWGTLTFGTSGIIDYHATILVKEGIAGILNSRNGGIFNLFFRCENGTVSTTNANLTFIAKEYGLSESDFIANVSGNIVTFYVKKVTQYSRYHFKLLQGAIRTGKSSILEIIGTNAVPETSDPSATITATSIVLDNISTQTISGIKTFATGATPLITDAPTTELMAVNKAYADGLTGLAMVYDKVIRTQAQFEALIASPTWLDAVSVALVGQFTATVNITIPATVKQIHGYNGAKITITISTDVDTVGLGYETKPTTTDYSYKDIFVELINTNTNNDANIYAIKNMVNLYSPIAKAINYNEEITTGIAVGIASCNNVVNPMSVGLRITASAVKAIKGYAFKDINGCVNAKILPGSTWYTDMWTGTNTNIDVDTCCKTPVTANNTTLNT